MLTDLVSRYQTIGHQILDLEAELGVSTEPHKETLDRLIEEARARIQVKDVYTREDAIDILSIINGVIISNGLNLRTTDGDHLFHDDLQAKSIDCDNTSFIYLSIAEALKLPLAAVHVPQHIFVRFMFNNVSYINWETIIPAVLSDDDYKQGLNIADAAIENGVFLKNLTRDGVIALAYTNRGNAWYKKGNLDNAIRDYNKAIRIDPNHSLAYTNRGNAWYKKGNLDKATLDYNDAIRLDPKDAVAYNNRGNAWYKKGNLDNAFEDLNEAIRIDPNNAVAYTNRGNAWKKKGDLNGAIQDYNEAIRLDPNNAAAYNNRGIAWFDIHNLDRAIEDFNKSISLNPNYTAAHNNRRIALARKG